MPYCPDDYGDIANFWAVMRYERGDGTIEITYGDKNFRLESHFYSGPVERYGLNDILQASQKPPAVILPLSAVLEISFLQSCIITLAETLHAHIDCFIEPSQHVLKRAGRIRRMFLEHRIREDYRRELEDASLKAARAFILEDYKAVIFWLRPYQKNLTRTDRKKLELAKERFLKY